MKRRWLPVDPLVLLVCAALSAEALGQDWPSLRGPSHDGAASGDVAGLATGPLELRVVWKRAAGSGYSGVVKSGDRIATAMADAEAGKEFVVAMDAGTGETLWRTPTGPIFKGENGSFDGPIATPAIDDERVYHLSPHGDLAAYRLDDGKVVWSKNLKEEFGAEPNFYGFGASPILHGGRLIVPVGGAEGTVVAFDPADGSIAWKAGGDEAVAFQSPVPVEIDGATALLVAGNTKLMAVEPTSGRLLWSAPHRGASGESAWSIVPVALPDGGVFVIDSQHSSTALDLAADAPSTRWTGRDIRNTYCVPVVSGGLLCSYSSRFLTAVDPATGKRLWRSRKPKNGFLGKVAGRLVVATRDGGLHVGDVDREGFRQVAKARPFDSSSGSPDGLVWALPSIAGKSVYLRSLGAVARVDLLSGASPEDGARQPVEVSPRFARFLDEVAASDEKQAVIDRFLGDRPTPLVDGGRVHFVLQGPYQDVAVGSDLFGVRQERPLVRVPGTDLFYYAAPLPKPTRASYVFFADYRPIADPRNPRAVVSSTLTGEMEPMFAGPVEPLTFSWFDSADPRAGLVDSAVDKPGGLAGKLVKRTLDSQAMGEAIGLSVYLPPGYDPSAAAAYPVVFVHDGGPALASGNQAAIVDDLIQRGEVRPVVAVFIERRFYVMRGAQGYDKMFAEELLPMVRGAYHVSEDRADNASLGAGFGATLGLMGVLPASDQIARVGCHTPFAFEMLQPVIAKLAGLPKPRCEVLIEWGEHEYGNPSENWNMAEQSQKVGQILAEGGHTVRARGVGGGTDWVCWRMRSAVMWRFLVGQP